MSFLKSIIVAFQFLTRFYLPINAEWSEKNLKYSLMWFGLVGATIGTLFTIIVKLLMHFLIPTPVIALAILIVWIIITGGMHLDGLSDTCDGFFSNRDRERILEIMKDSRVGTFGVIVIVLVLFFKFEMLKLFLTFNKSIWLLTVPPMFARLCAGFVLSFYETVKKSGLGYTFHNTNPKATWMIGFSICSIMTLYLELKLWSFIIISFVIANLIAMYAKKKIGGASGDIYGAIVEIVEVWGMIAICII